MSNFAQEDLEKRVLILAPSGLDAENCAMVLKPEQIRSHICLNQDEMMEEMGRGAAALLIAEEGLIPSAMPLNELLARQPTWSDLPMVVLAARSSTDTNRIVNEIGNAGNLTILDRPLKRRNLISSLRTAMRARGRQYEVRTMLDQRDKFLAMLGHELRNPLSPIRTGLHVMKQFTVAPEAERVRGMMERQTQHLARLVDDLLDVARVINGRIVLKMEPIDLAHLVQQVSEDQRAGFEAKGLELNVDAGHDSAWVKGDRTRLTQVLSNLLLNAQKFTERGHVTMRLRTTWQNVQLQVIDTGVGIAKHRMERLFDIFYQADETLARTNGGLGLGLALCKSLVELHAGSIAVESGGEEKGATFTLTMPRLRPTQMTEPAEESSGVMRQMKILIIEDNVDAAECLQLALQLAGHEVSIAHTGEDGIKQALNDPPQVVICDIGLPNGVTGFDVARRLREEKTSRLIALTGYGQESDQSAALDAGFAKHLTKPVDLEYLEAVLQETAV